MFFLNTQPFDFVAELGVGGLHLAALSFIRVAFKYKMSRKCRHFTEVLIAVRQCQCVGVDVARVANAHHDTLVHWIVSFQRHFLH
jgi:hypothetical protein